MKKKIGKLVLRKETIINLSLSHGDMGMINAAGGITWRYTICSVCDTMVPDSACIKN